MREVAGGGGCGFEGERHFVCFLRVKETCLSATWPLLVEKETVG